MTRGKNKQQGAALLIVLVLVASLSFLALGITEKTSLSASRSVNVRVRMESQWYAYGAEALAQAAVEAWRASGVANDTPNAPIFADPIEAPVDAGIVRVAIIDDTACFNVNSLAGNAARQTEFGALPENAQELALLVSHLGESEFDAERVASVVTDWIDADTVRLPQGAEDETYTTLPSPYRTGNRQIGSVSEFRAMRGISRSLYTTLKPYLCAHPSAEPSPININMLTPGHAPLLAAALGETVSVLQAGEIIAARPAGGYPDVETFLTSPTIAGLGLEGAETSRFSVRSGFVRVDSEIDYNGALMEMTSFLGINEGGETTVISRRFGTEE